MKKRLAEMERKIDAIADAQYHERFMKLLKKKDAAAINALTKSRSEELDKRLKAICRS